MPDRDCAAASVDDFKINTQASMHTRDCTEQYAESSTHNMAGGAPILRRGRVAVADVTATRSAPSLMILLLEVPLGAGRSATL